MRAPRFARRAWRFLFGKKQTPPVRRGDKQPSDFFWSAFSDGSGLVFDCECGRTYFASSGDYSPGELELLLKLAEGDPDRYHETADFTSYVVFDGDRIADGCPCNGARRYEDFIWWNRHAILRYLKSKTNEFKAHADREAEAVNEL